MKASPPQKPEILDAIVASAHDAMNAAAESLAILGTILMAALAGMLLGAVLPDQHRSDGTRSHFAATVSVVATLTALVLGLAISNANTIRLAMTQQFALLASDIVRLDGVARHYGPHADAARATLAHYAAQKRQDLFPQLPGPPANPANPATAALLDTLQDQLLALAPPDDAQHWRQSQALALADQIAVAQWAIAEQEHGAVPPAGIIIVTFWLAILFGTYGLFTPRHATAIVVLLLSAGAVAAAILMILEARTPFTGLVRISPAPLVEALAILHR